MTFTGNHTNTEQRKSEHIQICLQEDVEGSGIQTGLEQFRFLHNALPEIDYHHINTSTELFGKTLRVPLLVSSMTGGTERAYRINRSLAAVAENRGWAMGLGSLRAAVEHPELATSYQVRSYAPNIPLIANLGAVQLNYGFTEEQCRMAVELASADALVLHLNSLQEVFQPEGNTSFSNLLSRIERICRALEVPVGVKEVGWGMDGATANKLVSVGVAFIDTAGAGGTSWSQVEKHRSTSKALRAAADTFAGWGIPTADSIRTIRGVLPQTLLFASGGLRHGLDAAKALALGADLAGFGRSLLAYAVESEEATDEQFQRIEMELRISMFGIGASNLQELKATDRLVHI
jgi:isopentenyl-diphosphate delta-isomerase